MRRPDGPASTGAGHRLETRYDRPLERSPIGAQARPPTRLRFPSKTPLEARAAAYRDDLAGRRSGLHSANGSRSDRPSALPKPSVAATTARATRNLDLGKKIYVGNLPFSATEQDLRGVFERFGDIQSVNVIMDRETGRARGFAFVEMSEASAAADAIRALDGSEMGGRSLRVNEAEDRRAGGGGGGGGGRGGDRFDRGDRGDRGGYRR